MIKKGSRLLVIAMLLLVLTGCTNQVEKGSGPVVFTVDGSDLYMDEVMYFIYIEEAQGNETESLYQDFFGESYWDGAAEDGKTNREITKERIQKEAILTTVLFKEAENAGYALSEEETAKIKEEAKVFMDNLTENQKQVMKIKDEKRLCYILSKVSLSEQYYEDMMKAYKVDEAAVTSGIYEEDYRQYNVEYLYMPTVSFNDANEMIPYSQKEKEKVYEKIKELQKEVQAGADFESLTMKEEEAEIGEIGFLEGDELLGPAFEKAALTLLDGEVYDGIVEEEDGYYLLKMQDDNADESYQRQLETAIEAQKQQLFQKDYEDICKNYKITIHEKVFDPLVIGDLTYDQEAANFNSQETAIMDGEDKENE